MDCDSALAPVGVADLAPRNIEVSRDVVSIFHEASK